jgi:hypothetical protein
MVDFKPGDRVRIKERPDWPTPPGYRFNQAEGTVVKWIEWDELLEEYRDYVCVKLEKTGSQAKDYIGKNEFFRAADLEKL